MRADCASAFEKALHYHRELDEIYKYYMPFRQSTVEQSPERGRGSPGQSRTNQLFDGTGLTAAFNFAGTMQADWMPPLEEFFKIQAGPLVPRDQRKQLNEQLELITEVVHGVLKPVHVTAHEMFLDLFAGTGALNMEAGNSRTPVRGRAVPVTEIAIEDGPWGEVWRVWWKKKYRLQDLKTVWPKATISERLARAIKEDKRALTEVVQYTYFDPNEDRFRLAVWCCKDEPANAIWQEDLRQVSPWIIPRFFKVPGETFGRGLAHLGLPFVKTANKARELALIAAAFAVMGLWTRRNDGVFNPDTAVFEPSRLWTVGSNGGPLGPTIQRLPVPQDFDVSSIVIGDERDQINKVLLNDELPDLADRVRSPTEIMGRMRRYARTKGGVGVRLSNELVTPVVARAIDILEARGVLPTKLAIDQLLAQIEVTAPAAAAQKVDKVERAVNWISMITGVMGPQAALLVAKVEELWPQCGRWLGVDEKFIRDPREVKELKGMIAQIIASQQQQQQAPPTATEQTNDYVNGSMQ